MGFVRKTVGAITGSSAANAAKKGAQDQKDAAMKGIEQQEKFFNIMRNDLSPFVNAGRPAINQLMQMVGQPQDYTAGLPDPNQAVASPGFQFQLNEGFDNIQNSAAARGKLASGGTLKGLEGYRQGLASTFVPQYQNQLMAMRDQQFRERMAQNQNQYSQLFELGRLGQSSAAQTAANAGITGGNITNLLGSIGNASAAGRIGAAQARGQGVQNVVGLGSMIAAALCDRRFKRDIVEVERDDDGLMIYEFSYITDPTHRYRGKMAQEIQKVDPDHVVADDNGFLYVTKKYHPKKVA